MGEGKPVVEPRDKLAPRELGLVQQLVNTSYGQGTHAHRELTTDEWKRALDELAEMGCLYLIITGGEIFVRPDAVASVRAALEARGMTLAAELRRS